MGAERSSSSRGRARALELGSITRLYGMANFMVLFAIRAIADLGVADHLVDGPRTAEELAGRTGTDAPSLNRVLRALACQEVFEEIEPGRYGLTPMSQLMRSDHPLSLRDGLALLSADVEAWAHFDHSIRTGESAFRAVHGEDYWDYLDDRPEESERFDRTQGAMTQLELQAVLRVFPWRDVGTAVDVGGGNGAFLAGLLERHPHLRGVLVDQAHVVAHADAVLGGPLGEGRCEVRAGSFYDPLPPGADVYMLKRVVWGHPDDEVARILARVRDALPADGRLLVLEPMIHPGARFTQGKIQDLRFLALGGGGARTPEQLEALLEASGLALDRVIPTPVITVAEARTR